VIEERKEEISLGEEIGGKGRKLCRRWTFREGLGNRVDLFPTTLEVTLKREERPVNM